MAWFLFNFMLSFFVLPAVYFVLILLWLLLEDRNISSVHSRL
jgi:hypothetical protein